MPSLQTSTRTRFAPSPTGYLHVGGIRTALFAYLVARQTGGSFILRLEDTDKASEVAGSAEHLQSSLKALGLNYDEGPDIGGQYGPYKQSDRLAVYRKWAQKLIDGGRAYGDPYTSEQLQTLRDKAQAEKRASQIIDEAKTAASGEGARLIAGAKAEIDQEVSRARETLREQVAALAVAGAEQILRREVDAKVHADLLASVQRQL